MKQLKNQIILMLFACFFSAQAFAVEILKDMDGKIVTLESLTQGKPTLIHLWASWCGACMAELPDYHAFIKANEGLNIISISMDNKPIADVNQLIASKTPGFETYYDQSYSILRHFNVNSIPYTAVMSGAPDQKIQFESVGHLKWQETDIQDQLLSLLKVKN